MGKGDKKSRRGKIHIGSHGVRRPRKSKPVQVAEVVAAVIEEKPKAVKAAKPKPAEPKAEKPKAEKKPAAKKAKAAPKKAAEPEE
jgi:ribosomal small subunit protein bTHX